MYALQGEEKKKKMKERKKKKPAGIKLPLVMVRAVLILPVCSQRASLFNRNEKKGRENYGTLARKWYSIADQLSALFDTRVVLFNPVA